MMGILIVAANACWDDNVIFMVNEAGDSISVDTKKSN
jgi:sensor domain CHASE-containing protein